MLKNSIEKKHKYAKIYKTYQFKNETVIKKTSMFVNKSYDLRIHL